MMIPRGATFYTKGKPLTIDNVCVLLRHMIAGYIEISENHKTFYDADDKPYTVPFKVDLTVFPEDSLNRFRNAVCDTHKVEDWFELHWGLFPFGADFSELSHLPRLFVESAHAYTRALMMRIGQDIWINSEEMPVK